MPVPELFAAFDVKTADPVADPDRFYRQACLFARFAALVYPHEEERFEQQEEERARREFRRHRPWWRCLAAESEEDKRLRLAWKQAAFALNIKAEQRIKNNVGEVLPEIRAVKFVNSLGTQCFVATTDEHMFICFRGTEPDQWRDIVSDLISIQIRCEKPENSKARIHIGFAEALRHVWEKIDGSPAQLLTLRQVLDKNHDARLRDKDQTVWITGHSLGGALATLAADQMIREGILQRSEIGGVFTFGQPRVGDGEFANEYLLKDRHFRFVNNNDVVTRVPPQNLVMLISILSNLAGLGPKKKEDTSKQQWKLIYRDVGDVVFVNRSGGLKLLKHDSLWWKPKLFWGRTVSRLSAPLIGTQGRSFMKRFLPGLDDHRIDEYNRVLEKRARILLDTPDQAPSPTSQQQTAGECFVNNDSG